MKSTLALLALIFSISAFAQDSVDLVLTFSKDDGKPNPQKFKEWKYAKVKFLRRYYNEMMADRSFTMNCYSTLDKGVQLVVGQGQMAVFHKLGERGERGGCNTSECQNSSFEDFSREANQAYNFLETEDGIKIQYQLESVASYVAWRNAAQRMWDNFGVRFPTVNEIPYVTIYSPKAHQGKPQVTASFHCYLLKPDSSGKVVPVEP